MAETCWHDLEMELRQDRMTAYINAAVFILLLRSRDAAVHTLIRRDIDLDIAHHVLACSDLHR